MASRCSSVQRAHTLLEHSWTEEVEAFDCLYDLSNERTLESVDLSFLLIDQLVARHKENESSCSLIHHDLWRSVLLNWQQVSREILTNALNTKRRVTLLEVEEKITSPEKLLALLEGWSTDFVDTYGKPVSFTTSMALSLIIDVAGRRGKLLEKNHFNEYKLVENAEFLKNIFFCMMDLHLSAPDDMTAFPPSVENMNTVLQTVAKTGNPDLAWKILKHASNLITPDKISYNAVLSSYVVTGDGAAAENVLQELHETSFNNIKAVEPDTTCWNLVIAAWSRSPDKALAAKRVENILVNMKMHENHSMRIGDSRYRPLVDEISRTIRPDLTTFNTALTMYARAGEVDTCAQLLKEMQDCHKSGRLESAPDEISYLAIMNSFSKAGRPDLAEAYLEKLYEAFMKHGKLEMRPSVPLMTSVLDAYSKAIRDSISVSDNKDTFRLLFCARQLFQRMHSWYEFGFLPSRPDTTAYNVMMACYLRASHAQTTPTINRSAEYADALLQELKTIGRTTRSPALFTPDFRSYSIVIQAWLQRPDGVLKAINLIDEVWQIHLSKTNQNIKPDSKSLHSIVVLLSRNARRPDVAQRLLLSLCQERKKDRTRNEAPRRASFGSVLASWAHSKHPGAAESGQELVNQMEHYHRNGVLAEGPDALIYSTLITCWTKSDNLNAAERAYEILTVLRRMASRNGNSHELLHPLTYINVIQAFSRGRVDPLMATRVLNELKGDEKKGILEAKSDVRAENSVLSAWARSRHPDALKNAYALFTKMLHLHQNGKLAIDTATYNILLNALAEHTNPQNAELAEHIVESMMEQARRGSELKPNAITFGSLIKAWVHLGNADRAERVLAHMCRDYLNAGNMDLKPQLRHFENVEDAIAAAYRGRSSALCEKRLAPIKEMKKAIYNVLR